MTSMAFTNSSINRITENCVYPFKPTAFYGTSASSAETDQLPQNAVSDQGYPLFAPLLLHCSIIILKRRKKILPTSQKWKWSRPTNRSRQVHWA